MENDTTKHEDGHSTSGFVCRCGQIHVRRGDRVRRGPVHSDTDESNISRGQLGTIVRIGLFQESVQVKWDRSPLGRVYRYTWPDPEGCIIAPASFMDVAEDLVEVQKATGLSSAASEALLGRFGFEGIANKPHELCEENLRRTPQLYHRVRILPDSELVQQWFDSTKPCRCTRPNCHGGVQWSSRADKHLGREALVLNIDEDDDTVQIETDGPCHCRIWYPRLALEPVYDPDLDDKPLFEVSNQVECRMQDGWKRGVVNEVLWRGKHRSGPCPYTVTLEDGTSIFVPSPNLIRKVVSRRS